MNNMELSSIKVKIFLSFTTDLDGHNHYYPYLSTTPIKYVSMGTFTYLQVTLGTSRICSQL